MYIKDFAKSINHKNFYFANISPKIGKPEMEKSEICNHVNSIHIN